MASRWLTGLKRFILWDYRRGSKQYDIMVALILAFIFLTPRDFFRDQPRAQQAVMLPGEGGSNVFWIEPELLANVPEDQRRARVEALMKSQAGGRRQVLLRIEPIFDSEKEIRGYMAFGRP